MVCMHVLPLCIWCISAELLHNQATLQWLNCQERGLLSNIHLIDFFPLIVLGLPIISLRWPDPQQKSLRNMISLINSEGIDDLFASEQISDNNSNEGETKCQMSKCSCLCLFVCLCQGMVLKQWSTYRYLVNMPAVETHWSQKVAFHTAQRSSWKTTVRTLHKNSWKTCIVRQVWLTPYFYFSLFLQFWLEWLWSGQPCHCPGHDEGNGLRTAGGKDSSPLPRWPRKDRYISKEFCCCCLKMIFDW